MRILLCGAGGVGKTTLVDDVKSRLRWVRSLNRIQEVARDVMRNQRIEQRHITDNITVFLTLQKSICMEQCLREKSYGSFISDRSALDCMVYTWLRTTRGLMDRNSILEELNDIVTDFRTEVPLLDNSIANYRRSLLILVCPLGFCHNDGVRYQLTTDDSFRFTECFVHLLHLLDIPYLDVNTTNPGKRLDLFINALKGHQPMETCKLSYYKTLSDKNDKSSRQVAHNSLCEINYPFYIDNSSNSNNVSIRTICVSETEIKQSWTFLADGEDNRLMNNLGNFCKNDICLIEFSHSLQSIAVQKILLRGVKITGDIYNFLGCSASGLKARKCYLLKGNIEDVENLLKLNGDFHEISSVSKRMARIGLLFSSVRLTHIIVDNVESIPDIENDRYNFTDGCGFLSSDLANEIFLSVKEKGILYPTNWRPVVFQIRYQGCKGVLQLKLSLPSGHVIQVRPSMQKFKTCAHPFMGICEFSKPYTYGHLNRQYITLLSALGIDDTIFLQKQQAHFELIRRMGRDIESAITVLHWQNQLEAASELIRLKCLVGDQNQFSQTIMRNDVKETLAKIQSQMIKKVDKLRIMIPKSRNIFGICDPEGVLEYGECFVRVTDNDRPYSIRGSVLVGKSPSYLLGDLRVLNAVTSSDRPQLSNLNHLVDCIVFPVRGKRPHSNEIAGSDLDGDCYFITWDEELIPPKTKPAFDYPEASSKSTNKVTQQDMIQYFSKQNQTTRLIGRVNNLFRKWADVKGADSEECQRLAQIFSRVIDAGKTGEQVAIPTSLLNPPDPGEDGTSFVWTLMAQRAKFFKEEARDVIIEGRKSFFCFDQVSTDFVVDLLTNKDSRGVTSEFDRFDFAWRHFLNITNDTEETLNLIQNHVNHINFSLFSVEERVIAIDRGISPSIVINALNKSTILTKSQLSFLQLNDCSPRWNFYFHAMHQDLDWTLLVNALTRNPSTLIILKMPDRVTIVLQFNEQCSPAINSSVNPGAISAFLFSDDFDYSKRYILGSDYKLDLTDRKLQLYRLEIGATFVWLKAAEESDKNNHVTELDSVHNAISVDLTRFQRDILRKRGREHPLVRKTPFIEIEVFVQNMTAGYLDSIDGNFVDIPFEIADQDDETEENIDENDMDYINGEYERLSSADTPFSALMAFLQKLLQNRSNFSNLVFEQNISILLTVHANCLAGLERLKVIVILFRIGLKHLSKQLIQSFLMDSSEISELLLILQKWENWWFLDHDMGLTVVEKVYKSFSRDDSIDTIEYIRHFSTLQTLAFIEELKGTKKLLESADETAGSISGWKVDCHPDTEDASEDATVDVTFFRTTAMPSLSQLTKGQYVAIIRQSDWRKCPGYAAACCLGQIVNARPSPPSITLSLLDPQNIPSALYKCTQKSTKVFWRLSLIGNITSFLRCMTSLQKLSVESPLATELLPLLVHPRGHLCTSALYQDRPFPYPESNGKDLNIHFLDNLNGAQKAAVRAVFCDSLTLIQGPPGTGKTTVACEIIRQAHRQLSQPARVLACAETNLAVDNIARRLLKLNDATLILLRVGNDEHIASDLKDISLDSQMQTIASQEAKRVGFKDAKGTEHRNKNLVRRLIKAANVILTTCSGAGDINLESEKFDLVVCDEATLTREPSLLCALVHSVQRLCLIGDHKQLGPFSLATESTINTNDLPKLTDLDTTLFHRLNAVPNMTTYLLTDQHRMHPELMLFPSECFYNGELVAGVTAEDRPPPPFCWPQKNRPLAFVIADCGSERRRGTSFENVSEANLITQCLERLLAPKEEDFGERVAAVEVGVIAPYLGQVRLLRQLLKDRFPGVEVSTVDGFQGREKEVILISTVRCNENQGLGFTGNLNRINVMLTRAKRGLILIGCKQTLAMSDIWKSWIEQAPEILPTGLTAVNTNPLRPVNRNSRFARGGAKKR